MPWIETWVEKPQLAVPRAALAAATCDSQIYAIGGLDGNGNLVATGAAFNTTEQTWSSIASMPTQRGYLGAASSPGALHALGGLGNYPNSALAVHEVYDPAKNAWSEAVPMPTARGALAAVTGSDGLIYAIGGILESNTVVATVEAYDPTSNTWHTKTSMQTPRAALAAVAMPDGLIYAIGGCTNAPGGPVVLDSVEVFTIATNTWATSPHSLPVGTKYAGAAVGSNGLIYLIAGWNVNVSTHAVNATANVYGYNPTAPGWVEQRALLSPRSALAADTGPDGLIYAIGGIANPPGSGDVLTDVEAYERIDVRAPLPPSPGSPGQPGQPGRAM
jgi:N-acetylneuraminic acid mutarotase